jgi:hypothetical protein
MLYNLSKQVAHCYRLAAECNERAASCVSLGDKAFYLDRENAWLTWARSFEFSERLGRVLNERQRRRLRNWPAAGRMPAFKVVPPTCLACNVEMLLQLTEPMFAQGELTFERAYVLCPNCGRVGDYLCN